MKSEIARKDHGQDVTNITQMVKQKSAMVINKITLIKKSPMVY